MIQSTKADANREYENFLSTYQVYEWVEARRVIMHLHKNRYKLAMNKCSQQMRSFLFGRLRWGLINSQRRLYFKSCLKYQRIRLQEVPSCNPVPLFPHNPDPYAFKHSACFLKLAVLWAKDLIILELANNCMYF